MTHDGTPLDAWADLRIGDRVRRSGHGATAGTYLLVELRSATAPLAGTAEALATIRDDRGETFLLNARQIVRA